MKNNHKIYISISVILFVVTIITTFTLRQEAQVTQREVKVISQSPTTSLKLVEKKERNCLLEIKNNSNKEITAYQIKFDDGSTILVDRTISGIYIKPNDVFTEKVQLPNSAGNSPETTEIVLETVVFNDNSSNGENKVATYIKERRLAIKSQLERLLPYLEDLKPNIFSPGILVAIQAKKKQVEDVSLKPVNESSKTAFNEGLIDGKHSIDNVLKDLEANVSQKSDLNPSKMYSDKINQLNAWLVRLQNIGG